MKILVVSESFINGGLETQIKTMYDNLPKDTTMIFAFSKYEEIIELKNAKIYKDFNFSYTSTISEFIDDVEKLIDIINKEKIDVIHVHPYYSLFPALFASQITKTKLVYTYHGISSFNFTKSVTSSILFYNALSENQISGIFSVNNYGINCFKKIGYDNTYLLHNPIDTKVYKKANVIDNKKWALFSRIDNDKITEIKMIIEQMDIYDIKEIDIYGSGNNVDDLQEYLDNNNLNDKIHYKGFCENIYDTVNNKYNGIIGIGRVLIEALSMGYPSILIGHKKVNGYINYEMYKDIKNINFINTKYNKVNIVPPTKKDIQKIERNIILTCDVLNIMKKYINKLYNYESIFMKNMEALYNDLIELSKNDLLAPCSFYKEKKVYELMAEHIGSSTTSPYVDTLISSTNLMYEMSDISLIRIEEMKGSKK